MHVSKYQGSVGSAFDDELDTEVVHWLPLRKYNLERKFSSLLTLAWASLVAQIVKNLPVIHETWLDPWVICLKCSEKCLTCKVTFRKI